QIFGGLVSLGRIGLTAAGRRAAPQFMNRAQAAIQPLRNASDFAHVDLGRTRAPSHIPGETPEPGVGTGATTTQPSTAAAPHVAGAPTTPAVTSHVPTTAPAGARPAVVPLEMSAVNASQAQVGSPQPAGFVAHPVGRGPAPRIPMEMSAVDPSHAQV